MSNLKQKVYQALETVLDPELGIDIVSLGLIYEVEIIDRSSNHAKDQSIAVEDDKLLNKDKKVTTDRPMGDGEVELSDQPIIRITMTLTTPGCPLAPVINQMVLEAVSSLPEIDEDNIEVELTFDPPWIPDMMSDDARAELGR